MGLEPRLCLVSTQAARWPLAVYHSYVVDTGKYMRGKAGMCLWKGVGSELCRVRAEAPRLVMTNVGS